MGGAQQWKINKVEPEDLNNTAKADVWWDNWEGFKTSSKKNWSEVNSPGSAINSIYVLMEKAKKNKILMENYISLFKEYIWKAEIVSDEAQPNNVAVSLFCQGLPYKVLNKAMNQNPTNLAGWYTSVQQVINARDWASILANVHRGGGGGSGSRCSDPNTMDIDAIMIKNNYRKYTSDCWNHHKLHPSSL